MLVAQFPTDFFKGRLARTDAGEIGDLHVEFRGEGGRDVLPGQVAHLDEQVERTGFKVFRHVLGAQLRDGQLGGFGSHKALVLNQLQYEVVGGNHEASPVVGVG